MPGTVSDAPSVSLSFANNFWGKEDAGVSPLLERMHNAKVTSDELKSFYNTRAAIEEEYARKLLSLCRKPLGSSEAGTLRASLDVMRGEVESMGKSHQTIAAQMKSELEEPLAAFAGGMKERRKIVQGGIEKLLKVKVQQTQVVNKSRDRYEQDCLRIKGYLAQGHMVMGQEERKNKAKLEKTQIQLASTSNEYEAAVKALEETTGRWNRDWKAACDKFQDLEEERLDFTKSSLWTFANVASTVCVSDDASCEKIRLSLESCEVEKDISNFIQERGTGQEIPDPPKYINFCRGDVSDTASLSSDDDSYSVAQFQRTINPAFRSSSPQPSTFESHHDSQSDLAIRLGHGDSSMPPSCDTAMTPQKVPQQPPLQLDHRRQAQAQAQFQQIQRVDLAPVPHNEYPADGMTMFCRTDAPSERSSAHSPVRPGSRDSQSEYSNPTSFSSIEPASGQASPTKQLQHSNVDATSPNKQVQKKRSGFFSNSPFRRKSKHEKDAPRPASRNTWGPASARNNGSANPSPTRPGVQTHDFAQDHSNSPEPVDPRASFQLNVGNNVFDVASPDSHRKPQNLSLKPNPLGEEDPIAAALANLTKQSSMRVSADRYHGIQTPAPPGSNTPLAAAQRGTPPPSYQSQESVSRLDAPKPAFTSAQMKQTTSRYVGKNQDMYGGSAALSRPGTGGGNMPRSTSPLPIRSTSPRPGYQSQGSYDAGRGRSASPNPNPNQYVMGGGSMVLNQQGRPKPGPGQGLSQSVSPVKQGYGGYSRHTSPNDIRRAASPQPQPQFARQDRPASSNGAGAQGMALQLSGGGMSGDGGAMGQHRRGTSGAGRPASYYDGNGAAPPGQGQGVRGAPNGAHVRSKSVADGTRFNAQGRAVLHYARAMYTYSAAIPEELSFAKGDVLAVLRLQDDGWWEAEVSGRKGGRPGLVPSNYLQQC